MAITDGVDVDLLVRSLIALGIGGLIGLERERHGREEGKRVYAGIRTLPLVALSGSVLTWLSVGNAWVLVAGVLVFGAMAVLLTWVKYGREGTGLTTSVAFMVTFLLGVLAGHGRIVTAAALGILAAFLLLEKDPLHRFAHVVEASEVRSALLFLIIAAVLLPFAPSEAVDPWGAFVPRTFVLVVVIVSGVSFLGFLAMRWFGASKGLVTSGVLAGLVDSDAAAGAVAAIAKEQPALRRIAVRAGLLAATTSFVRNAVIAAIADPSLQLFWRVLPVFTAMAVVPVAWAAWRTRGEPVALETPRMKSPFAVGPAFRFAFLFALITFVAVGLQRIPGAGDWAVYLTAIGGFVSSAAVVASMGTVVANGSLSLEVAVQVALLGAAASALIKPILVGSVYKEVGAAIAPANWTAAAIALAAVGFLVVV